MYLEDHDPNTFSPGWLPAADDRKGRLRIAAELLFCTHAVQWLCGIPPVSIAPQKEYGLGPAANLRDTQAIYARRLGSPRYCMRPLPVGSAADGEQSWQDDHEPAALRLPGGVSRQLLFAKRVPIYTDKWCFCLRTRETMLRAVPRFTKLAVIVALAVVTSLASICASVIYS